MRSKLDMKIGAHWLGLTPENQAFPQVVGPEDVARSHVDLALDQGRQRTNQSGIPGRSGTRSAIEA